MTVCIAAICENEKAVVIASDRMVTSHYWSIEFEHPTSNKITPIACVPCVALTAGDALAHTELFGDVQSKLSTMNISDMETVVETIKDSYQKIRKKRIVELYLAPRAFANFGEFYQAQRHILHDLACLIQKQIDEHNYGLEILIAGMSDNCAHIHFICNPGTSQCYDAINFNAIGSGSPHAISTLIARDCHSGLSLAETIMVVFDAKRVAEKAPGVGRAIDMAVISKGNIVQFKEEHIRHLDTEHKKYISGNKWNLNIITDGLSIDRTEVNEQVEEIRANGTEKK